MQKKSLILITITTLVFLTMLMTFFAAGSSVLSSLEAKTPNIPNAFIVDTPETFSPPPFVYYEQEGIKLKTTEETDGNIRITLNYPETESLSVNNGIKRLVSEHADDFKSKYKSGSLDVLFSVYRYNDYIIGFIFDIYEYNPDDGLNYYKKCMTYDLMGGVSLNLSDLFSDGYNYLDTLSKQTKNSLTDMAYIYKNKNQFKQEIENCTLPAEINFEQFVFDQSNMYIYFKMDNDGFADYLETVIPLSKFGDNFHMEQYFLQYFGVRENGLTVTGDLDEPSPYVKKETDTWDEDDFGVDVKYIALTFDDGPSANTPRLLDGLAEYDAKATFFVLGHRLEAKSDIVKRIVDEGHSIGNHSFNHKQLTKLSVKDINYQIDTTNELIFGITGHETTLLRPPYGAKNSKVIEIAKDKNMAVINWNVDPEDWKNKSAKDISNHIINKAKNGDIILLHDIYSNSVDAALIVVEELTKKGYKFVTVDELIAINQEKMEAGYVYTSGRGKSEK